VSDFEYLRNVAIGQYVPTGSILHRLDPRAKLVMATLYLIGAVAATTLIGLLALIVIVVTGLALARIPLRYATRGLRSALPFLLFVALLQVFTVPQNDAGEVLWQWRFLTITTMDLRVAALTMLRFVAIILGLGLFTCTTSTAELTHAIEHLLRPFQRLGLPAHEFSLIVVIALRFVPLLALEAERIAKAQASRGADFGRGRMGLIQRALRMAPLLVPLFVNALRRAETLALAMEARCYTGGKGRTHLVRLQGDRVDLVAVLLAACLVVLLLVATWIRLDTRFWTWIGF
jgi:energy-coupling factor transport system permease protein